VPHNAVARRKQDILPSLHEEIGVVAGKGFEGEVFNGLGASTVYYNLNESQPHPRYSTDILVQSKRVQSAVARQSRAMDIAELLPLPCDSSPGCHEADSRTDGQKPVQMTEHSSLQHAYDRLLFSLQSTSARQGTHESRCGAPAGPHHDCSSLLIN
jgi:hypothetical protein